MILFETFGLNEAHKRVQKSGDRLSEFDIVSEWDAFRPILEDLYSNKTSQGGRLNIDPVIDDQIASTRSLHCGSLGGVMVTTFRVLITSHLSQLGYDWDTVLDFQILII